MKNRKHLRILTAIAAMLLIGFTVQAQTSQEAQKQKQEQLEQEKQVRELEMKLRKQHLEQEQKMKELERAYAEQAREASRERSRERSVVYARPSTGNAEPYYISFGQENQSQLTIRNSFDGDTDSAEGEFDVDESTTHIRCTINGKANSGKITIKILYPGGKVFKDLSITSSAQISFSQSLTIKDEEKKKYVGAWTYKVTADKAEGSYTLSFMTH
ncbi:MAG: hypothetical protein U9R49_09710 [Bacteroidota bacterium]|nr:hypothetical protein [Bacteroidota bacterium]